MLYYFLTIIGLVATGPVVLLVFFYKQCKRRAKAN